MRFVLISTVTLLCAAPLFAQGTRPEAPINNPAAMTVRQPEIGQLRTPPPAAVDLPADTPVVTLEGVCDQPQAAGAKACKTAITREQMDSLVEIISPGAPRTARPTVAISYARLLAAADAAQRQHLDKDPAVAAELQAQLKLARIRVLTNAFYHQVQEQAANVPDSEIQKYYTEHQANFEQGEVRRVIIPRSFLSKPGQPMDDQDVKTKMDELEARAARGEAFDQLQAEAYTMFGIAAPLPPTKPALVRRASLRPEEAKVFDLNVGEVAQVLNSPDALVILKLESKQSMPVDLAQAEIKPILQRERLEQALQSAAKNVTAEFNLAYLGTTTAPNLFLPQAPSETSASRVPPPDWRSRTPFRRRMPTGPQGFRGLPPTP
jgi:hypothetical protein